MNRIMVPEHHYAPGAWIRIRRLPYLVAMAMEGAGRSGIAGSASERMAMVRGLSEGLKAFPENPLIRSIVPDFTDEDHLLMDATAKHDEIMDCLTDQGIEKHGELLSHIYKLVPVVLSDLGAHEAAATAEEYKKWILNLALKVAKAGKEGDFIGFGGEWFSKKEQEIYRELQALLH